MAQWNIEQKAEVWYTTTVEADTFEEAINKAEDKGDWYRVDDALGVDFTEEYWGENTETGEQFTLTENDIIQEA